MDSCRAGCGDGARHLREQRGTDARMLDLGPTMGKWPSARGLGICDIYNPMGASKEEVLTRR